VPAWLVAEFLAQDFNLGHDGRPNLKSGAAQR
jgi:hypothetical protein